MRRRLLIIFAAGALAALAFAPGALASGPCPSPGERAFGEHVAMMARTMPGPMLGECVSAMASPQHTCPCH